VFGSFCDLELILGRGGVRAYHIADIILTIILKIN